MDDVFEADVGAVGGVSRRMSWLVGIEIVFWVCCKAIKGIIGILPTDIS